MKCPHCGSPFAEGLDRLTVRIEKGEDGYFVAQCVELPAAISQGKTFDEAAKNIKEALHLVLDDLFEELRKKQPLVITV